MLTPLKLLRILYSYVMLTLAGKRNQIIWKARNKRGTVHQKIKLLHVELTIRSGLNDASHIKDMFTEKPVHEVV